MTVPPVASEAPASTRALELLLGGLSALGPLSIDMYLPAFPAIAAEFETDVAAVELSLSAFFAGFAIGQLIAGPLVDRFGRTRPLVVALAIFVLTSVGCALAPSNEVLIACRFIQALAGSLAVVVPRAVVRDLRSGNEAVHMLTRLMLVMGVAPIVAPLLGGWILDGLGWRAIFVALAGFGALALIASAIMLPRAVKPPAAPGRAGTMWTGLAGLLREPDFRAYALCGGFSSAGMFAYIAGSSFAFIKVHHVDPGDYGWFFGANAFGLIAASQLNRLLVGRFSSVQVLRAALALAASAALLVLLLASTGAGGLWGLAAALFVFVATLGVVQPNTTAMALERHAARAGLASAVLGSLQFVLAATAAWVVSRLHDGTAVPMALVVAGAACLSWLAFALRRR